MPETTVKETNEIKAKTHKERYAVLLPLDGARGIYKVITGYGSECLQQVKSTTTEFVPEKRAEFLETAIEGIVWGLSLSQEFYQPLVLVEEESFDSLNEVYIYECLNKKQTFLGSVAEFIEYQKEKTANS